METSYYALDFIFNAAQSFGIIGMGGFIILILMLGIGIGMQIAVSCYSK